MASELLAPIFITELKKKLFNSFVFLMFLKPNLDFDQIAPCLYFLLLLDHLWSKIGENLLTTFKLLLVTDSYCLCNILLNVETCAFRFHNDWRFFRLFCKFSSRQCSCSFITTVSIFFQLNYLSYSPDLAFQLFRQFWKFQKSKACWKKDVSFKGNSTLSLSYHNFY